MISLRGKKFFHFLVKISLCLLVVSCSSTKTTVVKNEDELTHRNAQFLLKKVLKSQFSCEWLSAKASVNVDLNGNKQSFKAHVRIKKDSIIWLSLSPALGIEVMRIVLTQDSVKFLDKMQKKFFLGTFNEVNHQFNSDFTFDLFQNYFFGNPVEMDPENKYISNVDGDKYLLSTRSKPKVRKAIGLKKEDLKTVSPDSSLNLNIQERRYERVKERIGDEDLLIVRYWINPDHYKVSSLLVNDIKRQGLLEINFEQFQDVDGGLYPLLTKLFLSLPGRSINVSMEYKKPKINEPQSFPFKVLEKYEQIYY